MYLGTYTTRKDFVFDILIKGFLKKETESDTQVQLSGAYKI